MEEFTIPVVDMADGRGWDETVEAEDARSALDQLELERGVHVASPFFEEHFPELMGDAPDSAEAIETSN